jgi:hypothetical protein
MNIMMEKVHSNHIFLELEDKLLSSSRSNLEVGLQVFLEKERKSTLDKK